MKNVTKTITLAVLMGLNFNSIAAGDGGNSGGGGGGLCIAGKCRTLAQAGFRIDPISTNKPRLDKEVVEEIQKITSLIPGAFDTKKLAINSISSSETFEPLSESDPKLVRKFTREYQALLTEAGQDLTNFQLLAISTKGYFSQKKPVQHFPSKTYLLPGYYNLDVRGKALIMIHEYLMRNGKVLKDVLTFDGLLLDYLQLVESNQPAHEAYWKLLKQMHLLEIIEEDELHESRLMDIITRQGGEIEGLRICGKDLEMVRHKYGGENKGCYIDAPTAYQNSDLHPNYVDEYAGDTIRFQVYRGFKPSLMRLNERPGQREIAERIYNFCLAHPKQNDRIAILDMRPFENRSRPVWFDCKSNM